LHNITGAFPTPLYGPLLALTIAVQGTIGFIAWPGLSPDPFGDGAYQQVILVVLGPSFLCYIFPFIQRHNDRYRMNYLNGALTRRRDPGLLLATFQKFDRNQDGRLDQEDCGRLVLDMYHSLGVQDASDHDVQRVVEGMLRSLDQDRDGSLTKADLEMLAQPAFAGVCDELVRLIRLSTELELSYSTHDRE
jgi:hypothetical protein